MAASNTRCRVADQATPSSAGGSTGEAGPRAPMPLRTNARARGRDDLKFFTILEVAQSLGVCTRTVRRWIDIGELVAHALVLP
jgi:hypothetical protein